MNKDFRVPADSIIFEKLQKKAQAELDSQLTKQFIGHMTEDPLTWEDTKESVSVKGLSKNVQAVLKTFPITVVDVKEPIETCSNNSIKKAGRFFIVKHQGKHYLTAIQDSKKNIGVIRLDNFEKASSIKIAQKEYDPKKIELNEIGAYVGDHVLLKGLRQGEHISAAISDYNLDEEKVTEVNFLIDPKDAEYFGIESDTEGVYSYEVSPEDKTLDDIGIEDFVIFREPKTAQEVEVPGLDEMIDDEKKAPADYRMLVQELEKIGELDAAKRLQKKIIEDEKDHFKYLKDLKEHLKNRGEEETANKVEAILIKESIGGGVYLKDIIPLSLQDVRDVIKKIFDTGEGVSGAKVTQAVKDLVEDRMQAELNVTEKRLLNQVVQKAVLEFLKTGEPTREVVTAKSWKGYKAYKEGHRERGGYQGYKGKTYFKKTKAQEEDFSDTPIDVDGRVLKIGDEVEHVGKKVIPGIKKIVDIFPQPLDGWFIVIEDDWTHYRGNELRKIVAKDTPEQSTKTLGDKNYAVENAEEGRNEGLETLGAGDRNLNLPEQGKMTREFKSKLVKAVSKRLKK